MNPIQLKLNDLIPEGKSGNFAIEHFELTEKFVENQKVMAFRNYREVAGLEAGKYIKLVDESKTFSSCMMSNTWMEWETNQSFINYAKGDVLIAGLGIGLILLAIQNKAEVKSITVIEKFHEVIELVGKYFTDKKIQIIQADIFEWIPTSIMKFDTIYFDIWTNICGDNYPEMMKLKEKFWKYKKRSGTIDSWRKYDCRELNKE